MNRVLIANRAEIAVRVIRGCRDAGIGSVAVYAEQDCNALHVRLADDAFALGGDTPASTYLDIDRLLDAARRSDADAVHPGYGFLSESADFAQAVTDAGLTWIGPPAEAIRQLGAKTVARELAARTGAPLAPGLTDPVADAAQIEAFAREFGLPVIIKAVYGGGGRGMKVIRELADIPDAYESAVRESTVAFGRGECFVERFLDHARHIETQCLADRAGNVVVVSTRDCSLQRRNQKLVEEAPAPFLTDAQIQRVYDASKAILTEVGYISAGTCEFLVAPDGTISFNEVNTRLQVEHPVSELVTGIDLVGEQLRIAAGGLIDYPDPPMQGHAIEFRINGEDPGRGFLPGPGTLATWRPPSGPGVRWDGGYEEGDVLPGEFDSLLGKLIVHGVDRSQALARARRALGEFTVQGLATVLPFHRAVVDDPAFVGPPFAVHTKWIETEFDNTIPPAPASTAAEPEPERRPVVVEVDGRRVEVTLPAQLTLPPASTGRAAPQRTSTRAAASADADGAVTAPMQAQVVKVAVADGQTVEAGALLFVVEAMKMEQSLTAERAGQVKDLSVVVGAGVSTGEVLCRIVEVTQP
ncbi:MAG: ATP-grasp domain-containing protein [Actinomycetota bacterium]|nr:ATP-grasp domain-containing protein [Actinomycetota bacterium]